jgi:hypothetical protein
MTGALALCTALMLVLFLLAPAAVGGSSTSGGKEKRWAGQPTVGWKTRNATRLKDLLLGNAPLMGDDADYDPSIPGQWPAQVNFELAVISIPEVSPMSSSFEIESWWRHYWCDRANRDTGVNSDLNSVHPPRRAANVRAAKRELS